MKESELKLCERMLNGGVGPIVDAYKPEHIGVSFRPELGVTYIYVTNPEVMPEKNEVSFRGRDGDVCLMFTYTRDMNDDAKFHRKSDFATEGWALIRMSEKDVEVAG